ncbi:MBL fold metallo-hydrolase [Candidatus Bipolaricaulota bacterium]|nr:MBL fold metallo-hydrolase [Candidatus Bipolaricaulota bacterium]
MSHIDWDHSGSADFECAVVMDAPGTLQIGMATITGYGSFHAEEGKMSSQPNVVFVIEIDGVKIVHFGDSAVVDDPVIVADMSNADVAILNVDPYVIPWARAMPFMDSIGARTIIPSHYTHTYAPNAMSGYVSLTGFLVRMDPGLVINNGVTTIDVYAGMPRQILVMKPLFLSAGP